MKTKITIFLFILVDVILFIYILLHGKTVAVFQPTGIIATQERGIFFLLGGIGVAVIIPILIFSFYIISKFREDNPNVEKNYKPEWDHSKKVEIFRWGLMCGIITIFAVVTWIAAHQLDPYRPLKSNKQPLTIQVVALQWRWLFIYPQQHIATINYVAFPENTPINFELTADAPMNSFWIPQLAGQIYAMSGMSTQLHILANKTGDYQGSDAEISGKDFAKMRFTASSKTQTDFDSWVDEVKSSQKGLNFDAYNNDIAHPNSDESVQYFTVNDNSLYNKIMMKYMTPSPVAGMSGSMDMQ